jgi:glycosyltransferase involved in cell wall biosynthesis
VRLLVVSTDFPPHRSGGYELKCAAFVRRARAAGHRVRVLTSARAGGPPDAHADVRRDLQRFAAAPRPCSTAQARAGEKHNVSALAYHLTSFRPHAISWWRLGELSMSLPASAGVPGVGVVGDPWMLEGPRRDPWVRHTRRPPAFPGRWLFVSQHLRDAVLGGGARVQDVGVLPEGVELGLFPAAPVRPWAGRLLYAGRLSPLKGVQDALAALPGLEGCTLTVAGAGALEDEVRAAPGVTYAGEVPLERMAALVADHDAVLFPSRWDEPSGRVPLEAMAVGRPVVATGTGGQAEVLRHEHNALLVPPGDPAALADAVWRLATDGALRARLVAAGHATALERPQETGDARLLEELEAAVTRGQPRAAAPAAGRPARRT